jgi:uncharacterized protein
VARARLVVIGTRTSHACHVLDEECLDDPALARAIAARFDLVRVDADERPDLDARWQPLASASPIPIWPLVGLADPDGRPLRAAIHLSRTTFARFLDGPLNLNQLPHPPPAPAQTAEALIAHLRQIAARPFGGFTPPPKHPHAPALALLLSLDDPAARALALRTLDAMAQGGIRDQLDGGFHRYATDDRWVVPHFEKRAQDQAALLGVYLRAFRAGGDPRHAEAARGIAAYVERRLTDARGGFACGEDADVGAYDDGSHYTWTVEEARAALDAREWAVAERAFDIYGRGELPADPTRNVLFVAAPPSEIARELALSEPDTAAALARARQKLLAARDERPRPTVDGAVYTDASAALARALLDADALLALPAARAQALRTLDRAEAALVGGRVPHRLDGKMPQQPLDGKMPQQPLDGKMPQQPLDGGAPLYLLADHAQLGLLALAAGRLDSARALADTIVATFSDESGGFLDRPRALGAPLVPVRDGAQPSSNALAAEFFAALGRATGDARYRDRARALLDALVPRAAAEGLAGAGLVTIATSPLP